MDALLPENAWDPYSALRRNGYSGTDVFNIMCLTIASKVGLYALGVKLCCHYHPVSSFFNKTTLGKGVKRRYSECYERCVERRAVGIIQGIGGNIGESFSRTSTGNGVGGSASSRASQAGTPHLAVILRRPLDSCFVRTTDWWCRKTEQWGDRALRKALRKAAKRERRRELIGRLVPSGVLSSVLQRIPGSFSSVGLRSTHDSVNHAETLESAKQVPLGSAPLGSSASLNFASSTPRSNAESSLAIGIIEAACIFKVIWPFYFPLHWFVVLKMYGEGRHKEEYEAELAYEKMLEEERKRNKNYGIFEQEEEEMEELMRAGMDLGEFYEDCD